MSQNKLLNDRREALEESFFKKRDAELLQSLRAKKQRHEHVAALLDAMSLNDESLAEKLVDAGIRAETWFAVSLIPLVEVAWADRKMESKEREAILKAASADGLGEDSEARQLLESWLAKRPGPALADAWNAYMEAIRPVLGDAERNAIREEILERARSVATAAGGFLGLGNKISDAEEAVLARLADAI